MGWQGGTSGRFPLDEQTNWRASPAHTSRGAATRCPLRPAIGGRQRLGARGGAKKKTARAPSRVDGTQLCAGAARTLARAHLGGHHGDDGAQAALRSEGAGGAGGGGAREAFGAPFTVRRQNGCETLTDPAARASLPPWLPPPLPPHSPPHSYPHFCVFFCRRSSADVLAKKTVSQNTGVCTLLPTVRFTPQNTHAGVHRAPTSLCLCKRRGTPRPPDALMALDGTQT